MRFDVNGIKVYISQKVIDQYQAVMREQVDAEMILDYMIQYLGDEESHYFETHSDDENTKMAEKSLLFQSDGFK